MYGFQADLRSKRPPCKAPCHDNAKESKHLDSQIIQRTEPLGE